MSKEVLRLEVPRVSVDFLCDNLLGRQKLTVLKYLALDEAIQSIGTQRFSKTTLDNVLLKPVREWISENWEKDFVYDLSQRNLPISFRASLAVGLFTTKITDYLTSMGMVEIYASKDIQDIFKKYGLLQVHGLAQIDYASLTAEMKRELAIPIVDNLYKAEAVARANLLFPNGIDKQTILLSNPSLIFSLIDTESERDRKSVV